MRLVLLALVVTFSGLSATAQWVPVDSNYGVADAYATNLVGTDAGGALYATVLAGLPVPNRFLVLRSIDDGDSWAEVFSGYNGAARGYDLGALGEQVGVLVRGVESGSGVTALLVSDDGVTWAETGARLPTATLVGVARSGDTIVVAGGADSFRSTDGGASWAALAPGLLLGRVVAFGGAFYNLNGIGQVLRLEGDAWTQVAFGGANLATDLFVEGGQLWAKGSVGSLYASADGATWSEETTARPTEWALVLPTPDDETPWFLHQFTFAQSLFLSTDDGATAEDVTGDYPRDANGALCTSNFAVTPTAVVGNAWACSFTDLSQNRVVRLAIGGGTARADRPGATGIEIAVPNPARAASRVRVTLDAPGPLSVDVVDVLGRRVARLGETVGAKIEAPLPALVPGAYVVRVRAGGRAASRAVVVR